MLAAADQPFPSSVELVLRRYAPLIDARGARSVAFEAAVAAILGSWALVVKARGEAAQPKQLLRRLWDWIVTRGLHIHVPEPLASEVRRELGGDPE